MVLTVSFGLSPVTGLVCHRRRRNCFRQLDTSVGVSGPHDFAVRSTRRSSESAIRVHCIPPRVRDDRETPLEWGETARLSGLICVRREAKYFIQGDWTGHICKAIDAELICPSGSRWACLVARMSQRVARMRAR